MRRPRWGTRGQGWCVIFLVTDQLEDLTRDVTSPASIRRGRSSADRQPGGTSSRDRLTALSDITYSLNSPHLAISIQYGFYTYIYSHLTSLSIYSMDSILLFKVYKYQLKSPMMQANILHILVSPSPYLQQHNIMFIK